MVKSVEQDNTIALNLKQITNQQAYIYSKFSIKTLA